MPVKGSTAALQLALVTAALWMLRGYIWPTLSNVEVGPIQASLDPTLFRHDFTVQESLRFTPRFYYNQLILFPARCGLSLAWSFAVWHVVALATLLSGVWAFARTLRLGAIATAMLVLWLLVVNTGALGLVSFYTHAPIPSVWAGAVAAWGAALAVRGRCTAAFACFGAAALLQFLVGFYAGLLALPALWPASRVERVRALAAWGLGLALVYVPLALGGQGDGGALANDVFVEIYAYLRHPHHLVPSTWPWPAWQRALMFYAGAWFFLRRTGSDRPPIERAVLDTTVALTAAVLALNYIFVEIFPLALVAKLQPARITPLAQAVILGLLATRVQGALARRSWLEAAALATAPLSLFPGLVLALAAMITPELIARPRVRWPSLLLGAAAIVAFRPFGGSLTYHLFRFAPWLLMFFAQLVPHALRARRLALVAATTLVAGTVAWCAVTSRQPGRNSIMASRFSIDLPPSDAPAILGDRFRLHSARDAIVLLPPTSEAWSFKLYAQRAAVVDDKNIAFTNAGLREWHDRMQQVLGVPFVPGIDAAAAWRAQSPAAIRTLAARYGARHVLTRDDWHPELPGHRVDREQNWSLWELAPP